MIKHSINRMWKGERVWPGDPVEGTQKEKDRLMNVGQAYEDSKPTASSKKAEIKEYLDQEGIEYEDDALKDDLVELL